MDTGPDSAIASTVATNGAELAASIEALAKKHGQEKTDLAMLLKAKTDRAGEVVGYEIPEEFSVPAESGRMRRMEILAAVVVTAVCAPFAYMLTMALLSACLENLHALVISIPVVVALLIFACITA